MAQRKEGLWGEYRNELRNADKTLYGGMLEELGNIMDDIAAARTIGLVGLAAIGTGAVIEVATTKTPLKRVGRYLGRGIVGTGVVTLGLGVAGELIGRKAYQVYSEVRLEKIQEKEASLKEQTEK